MLVKFLSHFSCLLVIYLVILSKRKSEYSMIYLLSSLACLLPHLKLVFNFLLFTQGRELSFHDKSCVEHWTCSLIDMGGGRPREESASEAEERRKEQKRKSYANRKEGGEKKKPGPQGREGVGDESLVKRREMYARRKEEEGVEKERGRPRKTDTDDATERRREQLRRSKAKSREKLPLDLTFLGGKTSATGCDESRQEDPPSILKKTRVSYK